MTIHVFRWSIDLFSRPIQMSLRILGVIVVTSLITVLAFWAPVWTNLLGVVIVFTLRLLQKPIVRVFVIQNKLVGGYLDRLTAWFRVWWYPLVLFVVVNIGMVIFADNASARFWFLAYCIVHFVGGFLAALAEKKAEDVV